jgi:hypothetical protein
MGFEMRTLTFILSAAAILFFTTCEESPTSPNFSNGFRSIKLLNLNNNSVSTIKDVKGIVYDCIYADSTFFSYATNYRDLTELNLCNLNTHYINKNYFGTIHGIRAYPERGRIFVDIYDAVYLVDDYGNIVSNLTWDIGFYGSPVFIPNSNLATYGNSLLSYNNGGNILSQNLETGVIDTLVKEDFSYIFPVFVTEDESHLIYTSNDYYNFSIKSVNLNNLQDIKVLTNSIGVTNFGKNRSINDKIVFTSAGTVYLLDLNTADLTAVATSGQFADISNDGEKVVFTTQYALYLINSDGTNLQRLLTKFPEKKNLFLPSFSSNSEQVVFVESSFPYSIQ